MTTLTIMRQLPREVDPLVYNMTSEDPGDVSYSSVGGLNEQIRELREVALTIKPRYFTFDPPQVIELPLMNPELFQRVGIKSPKGCLLYGPPGTLSNSTRCHYEPFRYWKDFVSPSCC